MTTKTQRAAMAAKKALTITTTATPAPADLLHTGCTMLNLAISGQPHGGFPKGKYIWMVGDSSSGKTFLTLTCMAEAAINPAFAKYRLIYDNAEDGALMDMARFFGPAMAKRLEPPTGTRAKPEYSATIEDLYFNLDDAFKAGKPFVYLLDSMDALDSDYAESKFQAKKKAARTSTKAAGDFGDGKAKLNSTRLRAVVNKLRDTGSILIILSQTRDNINAGPFDAKQTSAGGRALKFYACVQLWSSMGKRINRSVRGHDLQIGLTCNIKIRKNRLTGIERIIKMPIYYDTGIDDIGSMVDWLVAWGYWKKNKEGIVDATSDFANAKMKRNELVEWLDNQVLRDAMVEVVTDAWADFQKRIAIQRKPKYS